jgi:hypothetical protein
MESLSKVASGASLLARRSTSTATTTPGVKMSTHHRPEGDGSNDRTIQVVTRAEAIGTA